MSHVRYDGEGAGLGRRERTGNAHDPANYTLICTCKKELGPLGRFLPNKDGHRTAYCLVCKHITVVTKDGSVSYAEAPKEVIEQMAQRALEAQKRSA
jgi:hypothetical protein